MDLDATIDKLKAEVKALRSKLPGEYVHIKSEVEPGKMHKIWLDRPSKEKDDMLMKIYDIEKDIRNLEYTKERRMRQADISKNIDRRREDGLPYDENDLDF